MIFFVHKICRALNSLGIFWHATLTNWSVKFRYPNNPIRYIRKPPYFSVILQKGTNFLVLPVLLPRMTESFQIWSTMKEMNFSKGANHIFWS